MELCRAVQQGLSSMVGVSVCVRCPQAHTGVRRGAIRARGGASHVSFSSLARSGRLWQRLEKRLTQRIVICSACDHIMVKCYNEWLGVGKHVQPPAKRLLGRRRHRVCSHVDVKQGPHKGGGGHRPNLCVGDVQHAFNLTEWTQALSGEAIIFQRRLINASLPACRQRW